MQGSIRTRGNPLSDLVLSPNPSSTPNLGNPLQRFTPDAGLSRGGWRVARTAYFRRRIKAPSLHGHSCSPFLAGTRNRHLFTQHAPHGFSQRQIPIRQHIGSHHYTHQPVWQPTHFLSFLVPALLLLQTTNFSTQPFQLLHGMQLDTLRGAARDCLVLDRINGINSKCECVVATKN